jgi:hypothetical protein
LAAGLALVFLPARAEAEIVAPFSGRGALAVTADGSPRVVFLSGRDVVLARRSAPSEWSFARTGRVPRGNAVIAGLVVDRQGRASILVEAENGSWLGLASRGRKLRIVARPRRGASFGPAGLALDAAGRPAFAYAVRLKSGKTFLRLVTSDARRRLRTIPITKGGFPSSGLPPGAAPVLLGGRLHVVETYTSAAIDWAPLKKGVWEGQYLFASRIGSPTGRVGAAASGPDLWSAWTQLSAEALSVLLSHSRTTQETTIVLEHGIFVSLLLESGVPEVGALDWAQIGDWYSYAAVLADESGAFSELDGHLEGYVAAPGGRRQVLLSTPTGLEWFESPVRPSIRVSLTAEASGHLAGRVDGVTGGLVQLWRETPIAPHDLIGNVELEADGSFVFDDGPPTSPTLYRAVYVDFATGIPYASLLRAPIG